MRFLLLAGTMLAASALASAATSSWESIQKQPDLERRSREALEYARKQVDPVLAAFREGRPEKARQALDRIVAAAELAQEALAATGKNPRRSPKHFKRAEIETRNLIRDLEGVARKLTFEERGALKPALDRLGEINSELLFGIMERKK